MPSEPDDLKHRFDRLIENLHEVYGISYSDILALSEGKASREPRTELCLVPLQALRNRELGILEALTLHLRDERGMRFSEIAKALDRDPRTIWATYSKARMKLHATTKGK
jgi:DNA-binding NarL/FixJ family response regulator